MGWIGNLVRRSGALMGSREKWVNREFSGGEVWRLGDLVRRGWGVGSSGKDREFSGEKWCG